MRVSPLDWKVFYLRLNFIKLRAIRFENPAHQKAFDLELLEMRKKLLRLEKTQFLRTNEKIKVLRSQIGKAPEVPDWFKNIFSSEGGTP
jgi:hypothetical protein